MSKVTQDPHKLDSNVTINVPEVITIDYDLTMDKWYIKINGKVLKSQYNNVSDAIDYLIGRGLIKTSAYNELDKKLKGRRQKKTC